MPPVYELDSTNVDQWESEVYGKARDIVSALMRGETPDHKPINAEIDDPKDTDSSTDKRHFCEVCQWQIGFSHCPLLTCDVFFFPDLRENTHWRFAVERTFERCEA